MNTHSSVHLLSPCGVILVTILSCIHDVGVVLYKFAYMLFFNRQLMMV